MGVELDVNFTSEFIGTVKLNGNEVHCTRVAVDMQAQNFPKATLFMNVSPFNIHAPVANVDFIIRDKKYTLVEVKE